MSLILLVSIAIRIGAMGWSVVLWRRIRDWRMGFLTGTLALMSLRQILSLSEGIAAQGTSLAVPGDQAELPGLFVSVLAALATFFLAEIILERRATRRMLQQREDQLRQAQKMEAIGQLAGAVAHDFNNLLTVVFANARLAESGLPEDDPRRKMLSDIRDAGERGARLIRQLLAFARRHPLAPQPLDLCEVVTDLDAVLRRLIGRGIELETHVPDHPVVVEADRSQLEQVVVNLAVNARDAMPDGGRLDIRVTVESFGQNGSRGHANGKKGDYALLEIADDGEGMSDEVRDRCFEPFYTTKAEGHGSGLGLATCYGVVKQSGGFIDIDSTLGRGTSFRIYLPRLRPESEVQPAETDSNVERRVLVVDDDPDVLRAVGEMLERHDFVVIKATTGTDAARIARNEKDPIDLLISDVALPDIRGDVLAAELCVPRPTMQVLLISGTVDAEHLSGGFALLEKPFSEEALVRRVRQLLGAPRSAPVAARLQ